MVYDINSGNATCGQNVCEAHRRDIEQEIVKEVCACVADALGVPYPERRIVLPLLERAIGEKINNNTGPGLLQQYQAYVLDKSSERLVKELELGNVKVNHGHATHAKFADIIEAIKNNNVGPAFAP